MGIFADLREGTIATHTKLAVQNNWCCFLFLVLAAFIVVINTHTHTQTPLQQGTVATEECSAFDFARFVTATDGEKMLLYLGFRFLSREQEWFDWIKQINTQFENVFTRQRLEFNWIFSNRHYGRLGCTNEAKRGYSLPQCTNMYVWLFACVCPAYTSTKHSHSPASYFIRSRMLYSSYPYMKYGRYKCGVRACVRWLMCAFDCKWRKEILCESSKWLYLYMSWSTVVCAVCRAFFAYTSILIHSISVILYDVWLCIICMG